MTARVEVNLGGPVQLDVIGARRGSRWYLPMVLTFVADDDVDVNDITGATLWLKRTNEKGDTATPVLELEATLTVASALEILVEFECPATDTPEVDAGSYSYDWELASSDDKLDGWAPTHGLWRVPERVVERGGS